MVLDTEISTATCPHEPECPADSCSFTLESRKKAEAKLQKVIEELYPDRKPKTVKPAPTKPMFSKPVAKKPMPSKGPSTLTTKSAAAALSQPGIPKTAQPITKAPMPTPKPRLPFSNISSRKQIPQPTNPSEMRHTAATLASKTTIGRSAGRSVSATLHKPAVSSKAAQAAPEKPDTNLPPALYIQRYGEPKWGSEMWVKCRDAGCFEDDQGDVFGDGGSVFDDLDREDADREFVLEI